MTAGNEIRPSRQQGESWSVERITNDKASQGHRLHTIQEDVKLLSKPASNASRRSGLRGRKTGQAVKEKAQGFAPFACQPTETFRGWATSL